MTLRQWAANLTDAERKQNARIAAGIVAVIRVLLVVKPDVRKVKR